MNGIVAGADPIDWRMIGIAVGGWRHRMNDNLAVPGIFGVDAGEASEHPFADRAKGVMGE